MKQFQIDPSEFLVLIVDDTEANIKLLSHVLRTEGFNPIVAFNGKDAIELIESRKPDLVLLDVMMPDMTGFEVSQEINKNKELADIPVIFLSALSETSDKLEGFESGGVDYITKPFQKDEVIARIRIHLFLSKLQKEREERISVLRKREIELSALNKKKDDLVRMVSHDIKNPLTGIVGLVDLLQKDNNFSKEERSEMLSVMKESGIKLLDLVEDVLDSESESGNIDTVNLKETDLNLLGKKVISVNNPKAILKDIDLSLKTDLTVNPVKLDMVKMEIALNNLVSNALKFTPSNGSVELTIKTDREFVYFTVKDTGIGIPENIAESLFGEGGSNGVISSLGTDGEIGTGLGLDVVQNYIKLHEGIVNVDSTEMEGSTFEIKIPLK